MEDKVKEIAMIILKIFVFILLFVFVLGMLGGMGLLGFANVLKKQFNEMAGGFAPGASTAEKKERVESADVVMEECPKCGTYTEKNNYCEACGYKW